MIVAMIFAALCGCATRGIETSAKIISDGFSPGRGKGRDDIEIYTSSPPARPYAEVATIRAMGIDKSEKEGLLEAMKIRAAMIGADALMNIEFATEPVTGGPTGAMHCPTWKECSYLGGDSLITSRPTARATAIVYTRGSAETEAPVEAAPSESLEGEHAPEAPGEMLEDDDPGESP